MVETLDMFFQDDVLCSVSPWHGDGLLVDEGSPLDHEVFIHVHSNYYYTEQRLFIGATQPLVRVRPGVPLRYVSRGWDFGWVMARTDGYTARLLVAPYTLRFHRSTSAHSVRWFVR